MTLDCPLYTPNIVCCKCAEDDYGYDKAWLGGCPFYPSASRFRQQVYKKSEELVADGFAQQAEQFSAFGDAAYRSGSTFQQWVERWRELIDWNHYFGEVTYASTDEEDDVVEEKPRPNYRFKPMAYRQPQRQRPMRVARSNCGRRR